MCKFSESLHKLNYHDTYLLGTLNSKKHWTNPETDSADTHQTENGQNGLLCIGPQISPQSFDYNNLLSVRFKRGLLVKEFL